MKAPHIGKLALASTLALAAATSAQAQTAKDLTDDQATPGDVLTYGMGYANQRYSTLKKIDKGNVNKLVPVWNYSMNNSHGQESQPIIFDGVMYVTSHTATMAIDPLTGRQIWKQELEFASDVFKMACCGLLNRGVAILNGKVYRTTLDAHVIAYDAKTGKQVWKQKAADYQDGHAMTAAPLIANGVLMTGIAGGEYGTRGFIDGWNPETGAKLWRFYTTAAGTEKGADTWPGDTAMKGGAPTWLTGAYDADTTSSTGAPATAVRGTPRRARATTCTSARWSRSGRRQASWCGTTSSRRTTRTTTTPPKSACWST